MIFCFFSEHHECLEFKPTDDDPLHCLNEFISLEQMLRRLQEEIHGLDTSIREISTNYQFPATLTTTPPASVHSKLKSAANVVKNYQKELDTTHEQFSSAYWNHSLNEYLWVLFFAELSQCHSLYTLNKLVTLKLEFVILHLLLLIIEVVCGISVFRNVAVYVQG